MIEKTPSKNQNVEENIKELVVARIEARISDNLKLSIGSGKSMNKQEMINHVLEGDEVGKQIVEVHLNFIKAQASGQLVSALNSV